MNRMKALIEINVYGGNTLLATLKKHDDLPTGIYSDRPVKSLINLTPCVQANMVFCQKFRFQLVLLLFLAPL